MDTETRHWSKMEATDTTATLVSFLTSNSNIFPNYFNLTFLTKTIFGETQVSSDDHLHHDSFPHLRRSGSVFSSKGRVMVVGGTSCGTKEGDPEGRWVGGDERESLSN